MLVVPGNHDVQWWRSPFGLLGPAPRYAKYRRYFGADLGPVLEVPGAVIAGMVSAHGLSVGSLTWNQRDLTVKGHLPKAETDRAARAFASAPAEAVKVAVLHHNVLRGRLSQRMGLAHWKDAQARLDAIGADVVLCGHDHEEGAGDERHETARQERDRPRDDEDHREQDERRHTRRTPQVAHGSSLAERFGHRPVPASDGCGEPATMRSHR